MTPRISGKMDQFYTMALAGYTDIPYAEFHKYITRKMDNWYRLFPFKNNDDAAEDDSFRGEEVDLVDVPAVDASKVGRSFNMSAGEEDEAGIADGDTLCDGEKEADNVAAVDAAEARLASAGCAAVAAAGAGELASAAAAGSRPKTRVVHGNEYTGLLNAASAQAIWPAQFDK